MPFYIAQSSKEGRFSRSWFNIARTYIEGLRVDTGRLLGLMTKIRDESTGRVLPDGTIHKDLVEEDRVKLEEAHIINKEILVEAEASTESVFKTSYESGHPACIAAIGRVVNINQETEVNGLYVADASVFPSPLGMPPNINHCGFIETTNKSSTKEIE